MELGEHRTHVRIRSRLPQFFTRLPRLSAHLPAAGGLAALSGFLAFRLALEASIRNTGWRTTGFLSYEAYYPLVYARELARTDSWLLFQNPFGPLDNHAGLYDGMGTLLRLGQPLWDGHLLAFDLVFGAACSFVAGWMFTAVGVRISRQPAPLTVAVIALVILGGGIGFLAHAAGAAGESGVVWGSLWGLSWTTNSLVTWELGYHALFWSGVAATVYGRTTVAVALGLALLALHPFTFGVFAIFTSCWWLANVLVHRRAMSGRVHALMLATCVMGVAGATLYLWILPSLSLDAKFMHQVYTLFDLYVPFGYLLLFALPALAVLTAILLAREPDKQTPREPAGAAFLMAAAVLAAISVSHGITDVVPQPAHWTRVYLVAFIALGALALRPVAVPKQRTVTIVVAGLAFLGAIDTAFSITPLRDRLVDLGPPSVVDADTAKLVSQLRHLPAKDLAYVRGCRTRNIPPSIEYTLAALTDNDLPYGHFAFSPDIDLRRRRFQLCGSVVPQPPLPAGVWVLTDRGLAHRLHLQDVRRIGRFELGVNPS